MNKALYDKGQALRPRILEDAYVDGAAGRTTAVNRPFQKLIAE